MIIAEHQAGSNMANKSGVPGSIRAQVFRRDGFRCQRCGIQGFEFRGDQHVSYPTGDAGNFLSIDHITPKSKGGALADPRNLRTLCTSCNSKKGTTVVAEFDVK